MTFFGVSLSLSTIFCPSLPLLFSCIAMCVLIWEMEKKRSRQGEEFLHMPSPPLRPEWNDTGMNEKKISWHFLWRLLIKGFDELGSHRVQT